MVAAVSGAGLGLFGSSVSALGGAGVGGNAGLGRGADRVFVNTATGNLVVQSQDEVLSALGLDLSLIRTYNSQGLLDDDNGDNWRFGVHQRVFGLTGTVNTAGSTVKKTFGDGREVLYTYDATRSAYVSTEGDGAHDTLTYNTGTTQWTWTDGSARNTEVYNNAGQLLQSRDADLNTVTYTYTSGLLTQIVDQSGQTTTFTYAGTNLTSISVASNSQTQTLTRFTYDGSNRLSTVTVDLSPADNSVVDGQVYTTTYTYESTSRRIASITQSDGSSVAFTYQLIDGQYRVKTYTDGEGRLTTLTYTLPSGGGAVYLQTDVLDALGFTTTYAQDSAGRLTSVFSPTMGGSRIETRYAYDSSGNVTTITQDPTGLNLITTLTYDTNGNLLTSRDSFGNTVSRTYNANNQLLTETRYLVPDPDGAGAGQPSVPLTTRYAYDGENHLRFVISAQGRVTEHKYNAAGQRTATLKYTGALYASANFAESDLVTWSGGQLTKLERTNYTYDFRGNLATLSAYLSTDASGNGTGTPLLTQFVYDQRGQLLQTIEARGSATVPNPATPNLPYATTYIYDGLGRVLSTTQWNSGTSLTTTLNSYDDANRRTTTTLANGLVTTRTFNRAGELIALSNGTAGAPTALGTTTYAYDADGRLRIVTDPTGVRQFFFYDEAGRKRGFIDGDGTLTEYIYNKANAVIKTVQYAKLVDATTLASLVDGSGNPTAVTLATVIAAADDIPTEDHVTRNIYDSAGQLVYSVDELGVVTQYFYDGAGRVTDQVRYTNPVTIARATDEVLPASISVTTAGTDRRTRYFYDSDGNLAGTLDGEGYLVEYLYDPAGYLFQQIAYATQTNASFWLAGTLTDLRPAVDNTVTPTSPARDIVTYFFYDAQGRQIGALDGESYLTETVYDAAGNITQTNRWDRVLTYTAGVSTFATLRSAATSTTPSAAVVHTTSCLYDGAGRKTQETDYQGTVTTYTYDSVGNLVRTTRASGTGEARTTDTSYDFLGRVLQELSPEGRAALDLITNPTPAQITDYWNKYGVTYEYDLGGRRISATVRPNDSQTNKTVYYYDNDGRLRFEVNVLGERKEYRYNALGQLTDELAYTNTVSPAGLTGGLLTLGLISTLTGGASGQDALTTYTYTLTGKVTTKRTVRSAIAAEDTLVSFAYNAFGELYTKTDSIDATATLITDLTYDRRGLLKQTRWDQALLNVTEGRNYDAFGRLTQLTDGRLNVVKRYEYDTLGREVAHTESSTTDRTVTSYDAFSRVRKVWDALGNLTQYDYTDTNPSMTITTPEGVVVTTTFNRHGQRLTVVAAGNTTTYAYDLNGNLTSATDTKGTIETHTYDRGGRELTRIDARGTTTLFAYDAANRVFQRTEDSGGLALLTQYTFDGQGRVIQVDEPNGRRTTTSYYRDGRIDTVAVDPAVLNVRTHYTYDRTGRVVTVTEGYLSSKPRITQYIYDKMGRRTEEVVDPTALGGTLNLRTQYFYDKSNNLTRKIDARLKSTWYVYDADNRVTHTIDALGGVTQSTYDVEDRVIATRRYTASIPTATVGGFGNIVTTTDFTISTGASDRVSRSFFDRDGREQYTIDGAGTVTQRVFDANGQVTRTRVLPSPALTGAYADAAAVTAALGSAATNIGTNDRVAWTAYDLRGRAAYSVDGLGKVTRYAYDANGNVVSKAEFANPRSTSAAMDFAALDAAYGSVTPSGADRYTRYWYDATDRLRFTLDAEGYLTEQQYNDAGRLETAIRYFGKPTVPAAATLANLIARTGGVVVPTDVNTDQKTISSYDAAGRLSRVTDALNNYDEYTYDAVGNKLTYRNKKGSIWDYEYDAAGRLTKEIAPSVAVATSSETATAVTVAASTNVRLETVMTYDNLGNVLSRTEAANTTKARQTQYEYDDLGRQTITRFPTVNVYSTSGDTQLGNGAAIARTESAQNLYSEVAYDALGNTFRNRDVAGNYSFKTYDVLGRVEYEVDAERYVTQYSYDVFGNKTTIKRYEQALTAALPTNTTSVASSAVTALLTAGQDRTVTTTYDRLNRAITVTQPSVSNFLASAGSGGTPFTAGATTATEYNAFGDVTRTRRLINPTGSVYADTWFYYDRRGLKTAQVDPLKYLMIYEYDETGDLKRQVEYAKALTGTVDATGYGSVTATTPAGSPNSTIGYDRETLFAYDRLNRKVSETRVGIEHTTISGSTVSTATGNQVTTFGYDVLGNQTRVTQVGVLVSGVATDLNSYTYYDVLGRVIASVQPKRNLGNGTNLTPFTAMRLDAFGNILEQIEYANGAAGTPTEAAVPTPQSVDAAKDRVTRMTYDAHGHVTHAEDAKGADRLASYTARGDLAKEWQPVTNADSAVEYRTTLYTYDKLGRQLDVTEPQRYDTGGVTVLVTNRAKYNAFGEVIERGLVDGGVSSGKQEFFHYDVAGRLWRTNSGDGITKVYLYDLLGNVTAEIRSQGRDLANNTTYGSAATVGALGSDVMRTETRYDSLGHVVEQRLPTFNATSSLDSIVATFTIGQVAGPKNPEAVYQRVNTPIGYLYAVNPSALVADGGGYYLNALGNYVQDTSQTIVTATRVTWDAPTDASVEAKFEYRVLGSSDPNAWAGVPVGILSTNRLSANVSSLVNVTYEYRVTYRRRTETAAYAQATGSFRVDGSSSGTVAITQNSDPAATVATLSVTQTNGMVVWTAPTDTSVVATLRVRIAGANSFTNITATRSGSNFQADARTVLAAAGSYDYEIIYQRNDLTIAKKIGTLTSTGATFPRTVASPSIDDYTYIPPTDAVAPITAQVTGDVGARIVSSEYGDKGPKPLGGAGSPKPIDWQGSNQISLSWASLGTGTITVQVDYLTQDWARWEWQSADNAWNPTHYDPIAATQSGSATATGATLSWTTPDGPNGGGGVSQITAVRVYKNGSLVLTQSNPTLNYGRGLSWARPADANVVAKFEYAVAGTGAWNTLTIPPDANKLGVDLNSVPANLYDYRVTYRIGGRLTAQQTGTLDIRNQTTTWSITVTPAAPPSTPASVGTLAPAPAAPAATIGTISSAIQQRFKNIQNGDVWQYYWQPTTNTVNVSYQSVGTRPVMVFLDYTTKDYSGWGTSGAAGPATIPLYYSSLPSGGTLTWNEPSETKDWRPYAGGVGSVQRVRVYGQDASGNYTIVLRDSAGPVGSGELRWNTPVSGTTAYFDYWNGSAWVAKTPTTVGSQRNVDVSTLSGTFQYRIRHVRSGEAFASSFAVGTFTVTAGVVSVGSQTNTVTAALSGVAANGMNIRWTQAPVSGASVVFEYYNGSSWVAPTLTVSGSTYSYNFTGKPEGSYTYRIRYLRSGQSDPYLYASGTVVVDSAISPASVTVTALSGATYAADVVAVQISGDTLSWAYAKDNAGDTVRFRYAINGGTYTTVANASSFSRTFSELTEEGNYGIAYEIDYFHAGETDSYARAYGIAHFAVDYPTVQPTITINSQAADYPSGLQAIAAPTDLGSNYIGWTTSAVAGSTVTFRYQPAAGGAWTELAEEVNGTGFKVNIQSIIGGQFNYEILYTLSGASNPYARAFGTLNVTRTSSTTSSTMSPAAPGTPVTVARTPTQLQSFDAWGNVLSLTDASSNTTNYRYNQYGQLIETKQPQVAYKSTINGQVVSGSATPITRNYYDRAGRLIAVSDANGNLTKATLNAAGQVVTETHADGGAKQNTYDTFGQLVSAVDELGFETRNTYDFVGNLTSVAREVVIDGFTTPDVNDVITDTYGYDDAGRRISERNGELETTKYYYDLHDNLIKRSSPLGANTTYKYDANDRKVEEKDPIGGTLSWVNDYFGRVTSHTDLGSRTTTYSYAGKYAGLLVSQSSTAGQAIAYTYDAAGHNTLINDTGIGRSVTYAYDAAGRRSREKTVIGGLTYQDTFLTYDVLNRISRSSDLRYDLTYTYDLQGNRTNTVANYYDHERSKQTQDLWYAYDSMNRVTISQGINTFNQLGINTTQGVKLTYNAAGQRTSSETYGKLKFRNEHTNIWNGTDLPTVDRDFLKEAFTTEDYEYDGLGRLTKTWRESENYVKRTNSSGQVLKNETTQSRVLISNHEYDKASRETKETTQGIESEDLIQRDRSSVYDDDGQVDTQTSRREDPGMSWQTESTVDFTYDAAAVLRQYKVDVYKTGALSPGAQYKTTYNNNYRLGESYQDAGQSVSSTAIASGAQVPQAGATTRSYNVNGELISFTDTESANKTRKFANGVNGQALLVVQGDITNVTQAFTDALSRADNSQKSQWFFFANGQQVGSFGQLQDADGKFKANFDVNYTAISDEYPSSVPVSVIAQNNDTLRTIAARVFGDQNLWYVLAEENGLSDPDAVIEEGTVIQVPNEVLSVSNSSSSFKPFNIGDAIGDTTPTQPAPPAPKKGCGMLGMILIIVVAIVVTIFTAGAAAAAIGGVTAAGGGTGAVALGTAALSGSLVGTSAAAVGIGAAAIGGAVGAAASQGLAIAMGMQDSFDWKGVALGAIGAGVTSGIGAAGTAARAAQLAGGAGKVSTLAKIGRGLDSIGSIGRAAVTSGLTQGIAVATGLQSSFSWRDVAISAVAAPVADQAGELGGDIPVIGGFTSKFASGVAGSYVRRAFGGKQDTATILADAFGNALGRGIVDEMRPQAVAQTAGGSADELQEVRITGADYIGDRATTMPELHSNPPPPPTTKEHLFGEVVVEGKRIDWGEDYGLDLFFIQNQVAAGMTPKQREAFMQLENLATARYLARPGVPNRSTNQALADAFEASGGRKDIGAIDLLERESLRMLGAGKGPNAVSGLFLSGIEHVNGWASDVHDFGAWLRGFDNPVTNLLAMDVAFYSGFTDLGARAINGGLGLGYALTDTDAQLMMTRGFVYAVDNPGRTGSEMWEAYRNSDFRDRGLTAVETLTGLGLGSLATRFGRLAPELDVGSSAIEREFRSTGARDLSVEEYLKLEKAATAEYERIRSSTEDVSAIAENTGLLEFQVRRVKNHLFYSEHILRDGSVGLFDADADIAEAWSRMESGTHVPEDFNLFRHEYFESRFERLFKTDYGTAHDAAQMRYPSPLIDPKE
jgi:YD repeat-containing protein